MDYLSASLRQYFKTYQHLLKSKTRDNSEHGFQVLLGSFLLDNDRTFANIDRRLSGNPNATGQNIQHFMSDSPWTTKPVYDKVVEDIQQIKELHGGSLNFDETGMPCTGTEKAGSSHQYMGGLGHTALGQVFVLGSYYASGTWMLVDSEIFLPEKWFEPAKREKWKKLHIPAECQFATKIELAMQQLDNAIERGLPFESTGCDSLYGSSTAFRLKLGSTEKDYVASVKSDQQVWLSHPVDTASVQSKTVKKLSEELEFENITVRDGERGEYIMLHAFAEVFSKITVPKSEKYPLGYYFLNETLVIRKESDGKTSYALSNIELERKQELAERRSERYFVERTIQDMKSELGLDEMQATKYRSLMHELALCAIALIFMAKEKLHFRARMENAAHKEEIQSPEEEFPHVKKLPELSLSNVKELLRVAFPLPTLSKQQAIDLVINHLYNRTKVKNSKSKKSS